MLVLLHQLLALLLLFRGCEASFENLKRTRMFNLKGEHVCVQCRDAFKKSKDMST